MNALIEPGTRALMRARAPRFLSWLDEVRAMVEAHTGQPSFPLVLPRTDHNDGGSGRTGRGDAQAVRERQERGRRLLLRECCCTFVPLMKANAEAYRMLRGAGQSRFNEEAFNQREAIFTSTFTGVLAASLDAAAGTATAPTPAAEVEVGQARTEYGSVVKTFQVAVWTRLLAQWRALSTAEQRELGEWSGVDLDAELCGPLAHAAQVQLRATPAAGTNQARARL